MAIKYTIQGLLIYIAMSAYLIAFVATLLRQKKTGMAAFFLGFLVGCAAIAYRWIHVGHIPMQNLFEALLVLGAFGARRTGFPNFYFLQAVSAHRRHCRRYVTRCNRAFPRGFLL